MTRTAPRREKAARDPDAPPRRRHWSLYAYPLARKRRLRRGLARRARHLTSDDPGRAQAATRDVRRPRRNPARGTGLASSQRAHQRRARPRSRGLRWTGRDRERVRRWWNPGAVDGRPARTAPYARGGPADYPGRARRPPPPAPEQPDPSRPEAGKHPDEGRDAVPYRLRTDPGPQARRSLDEYGRHAGLHGPRIVQGPVLGRLRRVGCRDPASRNGHGVAALPAGGPLFAVTRDYRRGACRYFGCRTGTGPPDPGTRAGEGPGRPI